MKLDQSNLNSIGATFYLSLIFLVTFAFESAIGENGTAQRSNETQTVRLIQTDRSRERLKLIPPQGVEAGERWKFLYKNVEFAFRWCPPGSFLMGSPESEKDRYINEKLHRVTLSKGFWILETEVSQEMYQTVFDKNPSEFIGKRNPVDSVNWQNCVDFCKELSQKLNLENNRGFALPTEAQWEYACRAGEQDPFAGPLNELAWFGEPTESGSTHEIGLKKPNNWGIRDMHGNLWEWTADWFYEYSVPNANVAEKKEAKANSNKLNGNSNNSIDRNKAVIDPTGPKESDSGVRIDRGGCWDSTPEYCRAAHRGTYEPDRASRFVGFRFILIP